MAWFRAGGGNGIPTQLKDNMDVVLNKKFGTSTTYPPGEWPDDVNLLGVLEEKTTTKSAIANIKDGADRVPIKNWQVTLNASLDGVSSVVCTQAGKNLANSNEFDINEPSYSTEQYWLGLSENDGVFTLTRPIGWGGTGKVYIGTYPAGTYTVSFDLVGNTGDTWGGSMLIKKAGTWTNVDTKSISNQSGGLGRYNFQSVTISEPCDIWMAVGPWTTQANVDFTNIQVETGSSSSAFEAYSGTVSQVTLGRTIYGGSVDVVNGTGTETYGLQTFDGTETWTLYETSFWYTSKPQTNVKSVHPCITSNGVKITYTTTGQIRCYISENTGVVDTSTDMNALLSNGVSFNYQLNENVDFTFTPITPTPETALGVNNFWADEGDSQVTYRSSGTETIIAPDLTTKSITENGTYNASSDNADGYSQVTVNVTPPAVQTVQYDNLFFDGDLYIELPDKLVSPNHSYFIDFTTETQADATGEHAIFGIKNDYYANFVGIRYNNLRYQVGQNGGSTNISNSWDELTGRHTFLYDGAGTVYFDTDAHTYSYNPSNTNGDNIPIVIGSATATPRTGKTWKGLIHRFTIRNTSTNTLVADYVPAAKQSGQTIVATGLLDLVSNNFVTTPTCSVSNDE